jgi:hypothetical protein
MMSRSHPKCGLGSMLSVLALISAAAVSALASPSPSVVSFLPDKVPRFVVEAAEMLVADFGYALAEARVSAGFVVFENDFFERDFERTSGKIWHRGSVAETEEVPLEAAVSIFHARHPLYDVEQWEGVLLIRAQELKGLGGPLAKKAERFRIEGLPLPTAFNEAMRIVDPGIPARGGVVGSILSSPEEPAPAITPGPLISVDIVNATVVEVLNEIVKQAPGTVWILSRHGRPPQAGYYTLAFRAPEGRITRFDDKLG